ncbi:hypothetical protein SBA4_2920018 [Candidatus Sulfopaludibacter sp. SbA4]|nr:hypothetical protein SBA4_2920018 [Candidatus Sulfopaludibacter sp. SbA4]
MKPVAQAFLPVFLAAVAHYQEVIDGNERC